MLRGSPGPKAASAVLAALGAIAAGCGASGPQHVSEAPRGSLGDETVREQCEAGGRRVVASDVNNDGSPDIRHVYEGST